LYPEEKIPEAFDIMNRIKQFHISGKRAMFYQDTFNQPYTEFFTLDHMHIMAKAISTTCALGFILKDLNNEFCARFVDALLLTTKKAKAIGNPLINSRATLGALIGEGNKHFFKYSMMGHIHLFTLILMEEVVEESNVITIINQNAAIEERLSRPALYRRILFKAKFLRLN
jgi:hypothetical protein